MAITLREGTPEEALRVLEQLLAIEDPFSPEFEQVELGNWPAIRVHLPHPPVDSSIAAPFMEAFLEIQKQVYQLAAQAKEGVPDSGLLSEEDKLRLQINVVVTNGSSNYYADLKDTIEGLLKTMIRKMTGKQATIVFVGFAAIAGATYSFSAWLEQRKAVQIEELKSKDHQEALKTMTLSASANVEALTKIGAILEKQGEIGKRAVEAVAAANEALLKAASKTPETVINGTHLSRNEAELLRVSPKKKSEIRYAIQRMRVLDINTSDPMETSVLIATPDKRSQYRIKLTDTIFSADDRKAILAALDSREPIWMELAIREIDGEVKSVQMLRTTNPPAIADANSD